MISFVNCFTVPAGREDEFLALWEQVNRHMAAKPGYIDHRLHRSLDPRAPFRFINFARWESTDAWRGAHDEAFRAQLARPEWQDFSSTPGLYDAEPVRAGSRPVG